jgi:peptidoglycan/xylan/chitin deacetylase (PgdA/CDA1 family)
MKSVLLTTSWDDGCPLDGRIAEALDRQNLRGTFYATTGEGGSRRIDDAALARIAQNHELANHGRTHTPFTLIPPGRIEEEVEWGWEQMARFGAYSKMVAPPRGKLNRAAVATLRRLGCGIRTAPILSARRSRPGFLEPSFQLYPHGWTALARNVAYRRVLPSLPLLKAWRRGGVLRDRSVALVRAAAKAMPCVHVWGHADDLELFGLWETLDDVLEVATSLPGVAAVTNSEAAEHSALA